ncbi:MFS transporter, YNFM family, putative membrane transport protein [Rhizobiales bacterium GAS188]|nr:MFS transporter, YNFM family, putative membrane transport protein [Rhizobiales bacterium GAS188]
MESGSPPGPDMLIRSGTPAFRNTILAMFCAGFATFALLYYVQPLLPVFSADFGLGAAQSSLALSLTTGLMAPSMLVASSVSEIVGRKPMMVASVLASSLLTLLTSFAPNWPALLALRAVTGIAIACLPAVAMAYVAEEIAPASIGLAMGLYIGGSALGGMAARLAAGILAEFGSWRLAMAGLGAMGLVAGLIFWRSLPPSRHFARRALSLSEHISGFAAHLREPGLRLLVVEGFLMMGSFVTVYNYIGYRLLAPPYAMSQASVGLIFSVYLVGIVSSPFSGAVASRLGLRNVFWVMIVVMGAGVALTLAASVGLVIAGLALMTFGFFGAHSIASSWVGRRARTAKAQAASLYLFLYYMGSSVLGSIGGIFWQREGWNGVTALVGVLLSLAFLISLRLARLQPLAP